MIGSETDPPGATPLGLEEARGLRASWITTRAELNQAEQDNILKGIVWATRARRRDLLTEAFILELHRRMFHDVWKWAGSFRQRETNIGLPPYLVPAAIRELMDTIRYWREQNTLSADEVAVRLHHRLVQIHPFPNGNGRHTRLMADLLIEELGGRAFTWGGNDLSAADEIRRAYISALQAADDLNIAPLLVFARS